MRRPALLILPALALVVSASCADAATHPAATGPAAQSTQSAQTAQSPASPATSPVQSSVKGSVADLALAVLATVRIARETPSGYQRTKFRHWVDADADTCNTREEVLIAESTSSAQVSYPGCKVVAGDWVSAYDGIAVTDPAELDIDHFVPLKEAWDSGAGSWTAAKRQQYANDLTDVRALVAVTASSNRSKGEKDPPQWMPPNSSVFCSYLSEWVAVKAHWRLSMDESEYRFIEKRLKGQCAGTQLAAWGSAAAGSPAGGTGTVPPVSTAPVTSDAPSETAKGSLLTVTPGAYCAPKGAAGTHGGNSYVCSTTDSSGKPYSNGRARWRRG